MSYIYILENKINHKKYVGQTTHSVLKRINSHIGKKSNLGSSIKKYGLKNFKIHEFLVPEFLLDYFEIELIKNLNTIFPNGYNFESGGHENKHLHKNTKLKISKSNSGKNHPMYGKHLSEKTKHKISISHLGELNVMYGIHRDSPMLNINKKHSKETILKMIKQRNSPGYYSDEIKRKISDSLSIKVINLNTKQVFKSAKEAADFFNICSSTITKVCKGKRKTCGGYKWSYL